MLLGYGVDSFKKGLMKFGKLLDSSSIILYEAHNVDTEARVGAPLSSECGGSSAEERTITLRGSSYGDGK